MPKLEAREIAEKLSESPELRRELSELGVQVKPKSARFTFHMLISLNELFRQCAAARGMRLKDAIEEAVRDWCEKSLK